MLLSYFYENGCDRDRDRDRGRGRGRGHGHQTQVWEEKGLCFALAVLWPCLAFSASWACFL